MLSPTGEGRQHYEILAESLVPSANCRPWQKGRTNLQLTWLGERERGKSPFFIFKCLPNEYWMSP